MGQRSRSRAVASRLSIGKVYALDERYYLALALDFGDRLVSLRGGRAVELRQVEAAKEVKRNEPTVQDLCSCWGIELERLDDYLERKVYSWREERVASRTRGRGPAWRGAASLGPLEARGKVMGLES